MHISLVSVYTEAGWGVRDAGLSINEESQVRGF